VAFCEKFAMSSNTDLQLDLQELEKLEAIVERPRWKQLLLLEKVKIQNEIQANDKAKVKGDSPVIKKVTTPTVKITSYAWDQSDKFVKIYLSDLKGVQDLASTDIIVTSSQQMHTLTVKNLNGKNYVFTVPKLLYDVTSVTYKVKSDLILLLLKKENATNWEYLTEKEKIKKDEKSKIPDIDKNADPSASIMNMMKKMYDEGDDEMKRTIAKAWTESRNKGPMA